MSGSIVHGRELDGDLELDADVVVVGSGAGGAVVAAILAEAGQDVIVVEAGEHVPAETQGRLRPSQSMRRLWRDGGTTFAVGLGDTPMINLLMGRGIGGSSALTGGVCFRIPGHVLREWSTMHGLVELTERAMEPVFRDVEEAVHVEEVPVSMRSLSTVRFAEGAAALGRPLLPMRRNTRGCKGCGRCNFGCPEGAKLAVHMTYLPRALRAGARIYSDVRIDRVTRHGDRANGVTGRLLGGQGRGARGRVSVRARRVVVAGGAWSTPGLLRKSGLGRQNAALGRNLTVHPAFRVMARFDEPIHGWRGALQSAWSDAFEAEGLTLTGLFIPPGVLAGTMPGIGPEHARLAHSVPHLAVFGGMIHDQGGGRVHEVLGRTFATYRMAPEDRVKVPRLLRVMAETFFAGGAREVFLPVLGLGAVDADRLRTLDLEHVPGQRLECSSQHPLGTCRMGTSAEHAVVDPDGKAWELDELYVADGSILPTSLGVNPQLSIMSMATRIGWKLRERPLPRA